MKITVIYALIYSNDLDLLGSIAIKAFNIISYNKIEQGSVLLCNNEVLSLSFEPSDENYYLSGEYSGGLEFVEKMIIEFGNQLHEPLGKEYNISS